MCEYWRVPYVDQEMLILSGSHDFTTFGVFMISPIYDQYVYALHYWLDLGVSLRIDHFGLTALSRTSFIKQARLAMFAVISDELRAWCSFSNSVYTVGDDVEYDASFAYLINW